MRATTWGTWNVSLAVTATTMLTLSLSVVAARASVDSMSAWSSTSRSKPTPVIIRPLNCRESRPNEAGLLSMTTTWCRSAERASARWDPTRPQPTMITRIDDSPLCRSLPSRTAECYDCADGVSRRRCDLRRGWLCGGGAADGLRGDGALRLRRRQKGTRELVEVPEPPHIPDEEDGDERD